MSSNISNEFVGLLKKNKLAISGDDIKEGLTCVLSTKIPDPKFSSQTKDKLVSSEVRMIVETLVNEKLSIWFDQNPSIAKIVLAKVIQAAMARDVARKARENVRKILELQWPHLNPRPVATFNTSPVNLRLVWY